MVSQVGSIGANNDVGWQFDNTYSRLPNVLFAPAKPATVRAPRLSILNPQLAEELGLNLGVLSSEAIAALFAGQDLPSTAQPIANRFIGSSPGAVSPAPFFYPRREGRKS